MDKTQELQTGIEKLKAIGARPGLIKRLERRLLKEKELSLKKKIYSRIELKNQFLETTKRISKCVDQTCKKNEVTDSKMCAWIKNRNPELWQKIEDALLTLDAFWSSELRGKNGLMESEYRQWELLLAKWENGHYQKLELYQKEGPKRWKTIKSFEVK